MGALGDARNELAAALEALGIATIPSPSVGHVNPPAAMVTPGPDWLVVNAQLGAKLSGRIQLNAVFITGKIAATKSLSDLEALLEQAAPALAGKQWTLSAVGQPFGIAIAGTDYLAASVTITRAIALGP